MSTLITTVASIVALLIIALLTYSARALAEIRQGLAVLRAAIYPEQDRSLPGSVRDIGQRVAVIETQIRTINPQLRIINRKVTES